MPLPLLLSVVIVVVDLLIVVAVATFVLGCGIKIDRLCHHWHWHYFPYYLGSAHTNIFGLQAGGIVVVSAAVVAVAVAVGQRVGYCGSGITSNGSSGTVFERTLARAAVCVTVWASVDEQKLIACAWLNGGFAVDGCRRAGQGCENMYWHSASTRSPL